mgnify:CR=1 FL=1
MKLRFVDKKHLKQLSDPVAAKLADKALIALHDLERQYNPQLNVGISSLYPTLDTDNETRWHLVSMLERYDLKYVKPRSSRLGDLRIGWQDFLSSSKALNLLTIYRCSSRNHKLRLLAFANWLSSTISSCNEQAKIIEKLCLDLVDYQPSASTIRKFLALRKPILYQVLVNRSKKVAR